MSLEQRFVEPPSGLELSAQDLVVDYRTDGEVLHGLSGFTARFAPGITGLIGPNGAGKTTFLRAAAGLLSASGGRLEMRGKTPFSLLLEEGIGFLPENPTFPPFLTVVEFFKGITPHPPPFPPDRMEAQWRSPLGPLLNKRLDTLSLGQRKKVALSAALLGEPSLVLLDEPTNGLDPLAVREFRKTLLAQKKRGATLVVSSHHLDELQRLADVLVFVRDGAAVGTWGRKEALGTFGTLESLFEETLLNVDRPEESAHRSEGGLT